MTKTLLIYRVDKSDLSNLGVVKKLIGQRNALLELGHEVGVIIHDKRAIYFNEEKIFQFKKDINKMDKWNYFNFIPREPLAKYDVFIIRYPLASPSFIKFLKDLKSTPEKKVIIDMPTFPFLQEWKGINGYLIQWTEKYFGNQLSDYVSYVLHSGNEKEIYKVPTIKMSNGIDLADIKIKELPSQSKIHFIAIGKWHGLDRLINGLSEYSHTKEVLLHIVGDGPEKNHLINQVRKLNMTDRVRFHGVLNGNGLDLLFDRSCLGIGTLGLHRKNVMIDSSLKHREYASRGLPFVTASNDSDMYGKDFVFQVPADESAINIESVIEFLTSQKINDNRHLIRSYAEEHLSWTKKMDSLMEYIEA